jgi:hypothetical protein
MATANEVSSFGEALTAALGDAESPLASATPLSQNPVIETPPETKTAPETNTAVTAPAPAPVQEVKTPEAPEAPEEEADLSKTPEIKTPSKLIDSLLTPEAEKTKTVSRAEGDIKEEEKLPGKATNSANSAFAAKTRALKAAEQELASLKSELEKARTSGNTEASTEVQSIKSELEETRKLVSDYESQLSLVRLEGTRDFKRSISEPIAKAEKGLSDAIAGYEGLAVKDILKVLDIQDPAQRRAEFKEVMSGVDAMDAWAVKSKLDEIEQLRGKKDEMLKSASETLANIERQETAAEQEARLTFDRQADVAFENTWNQFEDSFPILKRGQAVEWDDTIRALREQAVYLDKKPLDHQQRATLTYQAVLFPLAVQVVRDLTDKSNATIADLKAQIQKLQGATPGAGASGNSEQPAGLPSNVGFLEALEKSMGR